MNYSYLFNTMKKKLYPVLSLLLTLFSTCQTESPSEQSETDQNNDKTAYINSFTGTAEHGHVYPGATVPFGAVQLSPDNGTQGWDWCAGYNWADSVIVGFSHTHLSGTGIGDLCDLLVMPTLEDIDFSVPVTDPKLQPFRSTFSHDKEEAEAGYYRVAMDNGISAELSASTRVGFHRYIFPEGVRPSFVLDLGHAINWDRPVETMAQLENDTLLTGYRHSAGWARDQRLFYAIALSAPVAFVKLADSTALATADSLRGRQVRAQITLDATAGTVLQLKVGISAASIAGAKAALTEIPHWNMEQVRASARDAWSAEMNKITVMGGDEQLKEVFYTALYRTCLAPVVFSDAQGDYKGPDGQVHRTEGYTRYDIFSLWDTFRAANPLYTITQPDKINDFIRSFLDHYEQHGLLPVWSLLGNETNTMTGYHAIPVIADAYAKGFRDYDADKVMEAMLASAMQDIRGTNHYREYGYIPYEKEGQSVTKTLEYAYDDWCIAQVARTMGKEELYRQFTERAGYYRNMFDAGTGFMRAKMTDGSWKKPFDPKFSDHNFEVAEYTEGNAWQHSWFVPHDPRGLIELHGGNERFVKKLDSLFTENSEITGENRSADISGLIGQYAHGNEPSHHIAYLYNGA